VTVFGVHAGLQNTTMRDLVDVWHHAEQLGFGWVSVWDHFYAADASGGAECFEAVAAHAALACETSTVTCGCLVYSVGYRHPAVLANAIATVDHLSGGRAALGLGADQPYRMREQFADAAYEWRGPRGYVELDPQREPAQIFVLEK